MTTPLFDPPQVKVPRDGRKRPYVRPLDGGKLVTYTRCTTYVDCLEDTYHLNRWDQRNVAVGLADRPDLLLSVSAHRDDKDELNSICYRAKEAAKSSAASNTGTAVHSLCERVDRGHPLGMVPTSARKDVEAYQEATRDFENLYIEQFSVQDDLKIGGTPDRVVKWGTGYYIADIKTGKDIHWGALKIAMQLAVYAHSVPYDPATEERKPYPFRVSDQHGIVIHLPVGEHKATLHFVDLTAGWEAVQTAKEVRAWRSKKDWYTPILLPAEPGPDDMTIDDRIDAATSLEELRRLWTDDLPTETAQHAIRRAKELREAS